MKSDNTLDKTKIDNMITPLLDDLKQNNQEEISKKIKEPMDICLSLCKYYTYMCM